MKSAIILRHVAFEDLGTFEDILINAGYKTTYMEAGVDNLASIISLSPDLLVVLGGPIGAYDQEKYPFLSIEIKILKERILKKLPTVGICLGAQLIALALGGKVFSGEHKEIGWSEITLTTHGKKSCFKHLGKKGVSVLHWHGDTFTLPKNSALQASTEKYENQAFIYDNNILAIQFHPEVSEINLEKWFIGHACELEANNISLIDLRKDTNKYAKKLKKHAQLFFSEWISNLDLY